MKDEAAAPPGGSPPLRGPGQPRSTGSETRAERRLASGGRTDSRRSTVTGLLRPAVFLDRDGVIIENRVDHVKTREEVRFLPGALEALRRLAASEYAVVLVTNQAAIGRGLISLEHGLALNGWIVAEIERSEGRIDGSYLCPHRPDEGCMCRKPAPGMFLQAADELRLDLSRSYVIGDAVSDVLAARAAGSQPILVLTGRGAQQNGLLATSGVGHCPVVADLRAAVSRILDHK